jgi:hypothetical protein
MLLYTTNNFYLGKHALNQFQYKVKIKEGPSMDVIHTHDNNDEKNNNMLESIDNIVI